MDHIKDQELTQEMFTGRQSNGNDNDENNNYKDKSSNEYVTPMKIKKNQFIQGKSSNLRNPSKQNNINTTGQKTKFKFGISAFKDIDLGGSVMKNLGSASGYGMDQTSANDD